MSSNLNNILAGFNGVIAVIGETVRTYGGPIGREVGAGFEVLNGVLGAAIESIEGTPPDDYARLESTCVSVLAGVGFGALATFAIGEGAVAIVVGGLVAVAVEKSSESIYDLYKKAQEKAFGLFSRMQAGDNQIDAIKDQFGAAKAIRVDPLILDLDGDGIVNTTGLKAGTCFDYDGNGFAELTGWVGQGDGLLVWDRNGNGVIDDGTELFGDNTLLANGMRAASSFAV